jgi:DNA-directed RNA polymerase subunit RPC12/RpoP
MKDNFGPVTPQRPVRKQAQFEQFEATELYCPKCRKAVPVRKFLLLILPEGDKYEYRCAYCGSKVGDKMDRSGQFYGILRT